MAYIKNKRARYDYDIKKIIEVGIVLKGFEVKSVRSGTGSLKGAWCSIIDDEVFIHEFHISPYKHMAVPPSYTPTRSRKLLLSRDEIAKVQKETEGSRLTIIPLSVYNKRTRVKVEIALALSKKKYDKREIIKRREFERNVRRTLNKG